MEKNNKIISEEQYSTIMKWALEGKLPTCDPLPKVHKEEEPITGVPTRPVTICNNCILHRVFSPTKKRSLRLFFSSSSFFFFFFFFFRYEPQFSSIAFPTTAVGESSELSDDDVRAYIGEEVFHTLALSILDIQGFLPLHKITSTCLPLFAFSLTLFSSASNNYINGSPFK